MDCTGDPREKSTSQHCWTAKFTGCHRHQRDLQNLVRKTRQKLSSEVSMSQMHMQAQYLVPWTKNRIKGEFSE